MDFSTSVRRVVLSTAQIVNNLKDVVVELGEESADLMTKIENVEALIAEAESNNKIKQCFLLIFIKSILFNFFATT